MVQTVQFLDKVVALPLFLRQVHIVPDVRECLEVPQMLFCVVGEVLVTMQRYVVCMAIGLGIEAFANS